MKKTLLTVLIFAVILAVLMGAAKLIERLRPAEETPAVEETPAPERIIANEMTPNKATAIVYNGDSVSLVGAGAEARGTTVTVAYPGTYRVSGAAEDGQLIVDLGDYHGGVYLILEGVDLTSESGPALHVIQSDLTELYLTEGSVNRFRDGKEYVVQEGPLTNSGAGIYSADDLLIEGEGSLTVCGSGADGIRSKDALTVNSGVITVYCADDGLQASDYLELNGGTIRIWSSGDGIATTEGYVNITAGDLAIVSAGDGVAALGDLTVTGGAVAVIAGGGADHYAEAALAETSAKGLKGENIAITGGTFRLNTADDGIHGARDVTVTGGEFMLNSGDDAVHAAMVLDIGGVDLDIPASYEALEGDTVRLSGVTVTAAALNNGVDSGEGGVTAVNTELYLDAPRAVSSEGTFTMRGGRLLMNADGTDSLFSFRSADVAGADILVYADTGRSEVLLEKGRLDGSLLYVWNEAIPADTELVLTDPAGDPVAYYGRSADTGALLVLNGGLMAQEYTLRTGDEAEPIVLTPGEGCAIYEEELPVRQRGFPGGGFPGGPRR